MPKYTVAATFESFDNDVILSTVEADTPYDAVVKLLVSATKKRLDVTITEALAFKRIENGGWDAAVQDENGEPAFINTPRYRKDQLNRKIASTKTALASLNQILLPFPAEASRDAIQALDYLKGFYEAHQIELEASLAAAQAYHDGMLAQAAKDKEAVNALNNA